MHLGWKNGHRQSKTTRGAISRGFWNKTDYGDRADQQATKELI
jgi:hypothetical protein